MIFDDMELLDEFEVEIYEDPYDVLSGLMEQAVVMPVQESIPRENQLCLRLYSTKADGTKFVAEKSGLNQWNGVRTSYRTNENGEREVARVTPRDPNELYIPYPADDRRRKEFFPPRDENFDLMLPDGQWISAKVCQQDSKAIMSNPNNLLGKWLLRDVFELDEGTSVTYDMLRVFNVDSVMFTKIEDHKYTVDFCELGTYESFYGLRDIEAEDEENDLV